jgi:hypothetical protein
MPEDVALRTPEWWRAKLDKQLDEQRRRFRFFDDYYTGHHPLPKAPEKAKEAYRRWLKMSRSNWCELIVNARVERLAVQGIRYGQDQAADEEAWRHWQANRMDRGSKQVHLEAVVGGESYVMVAPTGTPVPLILPEHPTQMTVATSAAAGGQREAAWKKWEDESGYLFATLYLPDEIRKYRSTRLAKDIKNGSKIEWENRTVEGEDWPAENPLGVVPVVPFRHRDRMLTGGLSVLDSVVDIQDRINDTTFYRKMAEFHSGYRQRAASGLALETDPETGLPKLPFDPGVDRVWVSENPETEWHEFAQTDLSGYLEGVEADVKAMAAITSTPPHYLLGEMVNLAAEALKAAEAGLVSVVRDQMIDLGESWEEVHSLAFLAAGNREKAEVVDAEVIWRNPEFRTEGQLVDALTKMATLGVPQEVLWERWGASPQEIARWKAMQAMDGLLSDVQALPEAVA